MNKKIIIGTILFICCIFLYGAEVVFFCTADIHGALSGKRDSGSIAKLASFLQLNRNQGDITIDVGDLMQGSLEANLTHGALAVRAFNKLGYDFFVPGNHDLEFGPAALRKNLSDMNATVLCSNFRFREPLPNMKNYVIINRQNMRIGIIGSAERESRTRMLPCDDIAFADVEKMLAGCLSELRREKVDMIVWVRHEGIYYSGGSLYSTLKRFPEIDMVIGGHSHQLEKGRKIAGAYYVQPGAHCEGVSEIRVEFDDRTRRIRRITSVYHLLAEQPESKDLKDIYRSCRNVYRKAYRNIPHNISLPGEDMKNVQEHLMKQAVPVAVKADAYLFFVDESHLKWHGKLNGYLLYRMFPYENSVVTIDVSQEEYQNIVNECRKYSQKYKVKMLLLPSNKKYLKLCTTAFVLSGGGRNFPVSRRITEKNRTALQKYGSLRQIVSNHLLSR